MGTQRIFRFFVFVVAALALAELAVPVEIAHAQDERAEARSRRRSRRRARTAERAPESAEATSAAPTAGASEAAPASGVIEFDERVIRGESAGSGAVMLLDRRQRQLVPLVRRRTEFVDATVRPVLGDSEIERPEAVREAHERSER